MLAFVAALATLVPLNEDPTHQFDFWIGEWSVNNRYLQNDGSWLDGGQARARIVPVLGGAAIMEEWSSVNGGSPYGFSLRAYDPEREDWNLLLNWPGADASFGTLRGKFRHGRGEFFAGQGANLTRYSFSDGLPNSIRWDSANTSDGGQTWRTSWIMEFTRTRPAAELTGREPWETRWDPVSSCRHEESRGFDFAVGEWIGTERLRTDDGWDERPAKLSAAKIVRDHAIVTTLSVGEGGTAEREEFGIFAWIPSKKRWEVWTCDRDHTVFQQAHGELDAGDLLLEFGAERRVAWSADGQHVYIDEDAKRDGAWKAVRKLKLKRATSR